MPATFWPTDTNSGPREAETSWLSPGGLTQAQGKDLGQGPPFWAINLLKSGMLAERTRDGGGVVKDMGWVLRFLESWWVGEGGGHCSRRLSWDRWEANCYSP